MQLRFDDRVVLVSGASTGIGAAFARGFGAAGARVAVHYNRSADQAEKVAADIAESGGRALLVQADLGRSGNAARMVGEVIDHWGGIDVLVNNAGDLGRRSPLETASDDLYDQIMDLNVRQVFEACRAAIPSMRARGGGAILNVSSIAARTGGGPGAVLYAASKGAVEAFTRGLAKELAGDGIRVNAIAPGVIETPFHDRHSDQATLAGMVAAIPAGRLGAPEECVGPALLLTAADAGSYVTGQVIQVNGGQLMA